MIKLNYFPKISSLSYLLLFLSFLILFFLSCSSESPTEIVELVSSSVKWNGCLSGDGFNYLTVSNRIGPITIYGNGIPDTIRAYMYKRVSAENITKAGAHFDDISFEYTQLNDSIVCSVNAPENSASLKYYSSLDLEIFGEIPTFIKYPNEAASIYYMDTTVYVLNSNGTINLHQHHGSCDINTRNGDISIELILNDGGFCRAFTEEGNIVITIPSSISATLFAKTYEGTITTQNFTIIDQTESQGELSGTINEGNGEIHIETKKGNIEIIGI